MTPDALDALRDIEFEVALIRWILVFVAVWVVWIAWRQDGGRL